MIRKTSLNENHISRDRAAGLSSEKISAAPLGLGSLGRSYSRGSAYGLSSAAPLGLGSLGRSYSRGSAYGLSSAAPSGLGSLGRSYSRGSAYGLSSAAPSGLMFSGIIYASYQTSPNGAKDHSQGIHPLVNKIKFVQAPTGRQKSSSMATGLPYEKRVWFPVSQKPSDI